MNLQMINKTLKTNFKTVRNAIPKYWEFLIGKMLEMILLYYHHQIQVLIPINNMYMFIDFQKKFLNRVYTDNGLEAFTEELSIDTIDLLKSKGHTLKSLETSDERTKVFSKLKISKEESDIINQYYESLPIFKLGEVKAYVKDHDNIEEGDIATIEVNILLENHENPDVVSNIQRESFNYPGQEDRILKRPNFYVMIMEKGGKLLNYQKVPFKIFWIKEEENKVKNEAKVVFKLMLSTKGEKKFLIKVINDTYIGIDKNLDAEHTIKVEEKKDEEEILERVFDPDAESIDESADSRNEGSDEEEEEEGKINKSKNDKKND